MHVSIVPGLLDPHLVHLLRLASERNCRYCRYVSANMYDKPSNDCHNGDGDLSFRENTALADDFQYSTGDSINLAFVLPFLILLSSFCRCRYSASSLSSSSSSSPLILMSLSSTCRNPAMIFWAFHHIF
jgi:hypothetical protein